MKQAIWLIVILYIATISVAQIDVDRLFHANPPTGAQSDVHVDESSDYSPFRGPRNDEFDWALTKKVLDATNENSVFSPFLVKLLMSILVDAAGQNTSTHRELQSVLPSLSTEAEMRDLYARTFRSLLQESTDYKLNLGAKLYVDRFITPKEKFRAIIKAFYYSDVESLNFERSQEAASMINAWCANATKNHIKDIVSPDDVANAVIMLINTIYFDGYWTESFEIDRGSHIFWLNSRTTSEAQFMAKTGDFYYGESTELDAKILRIPYKGGKFVMYIMLPTKIYGLDELIVRVDSSSISRAQSLMSIEEVEVILPKFKIVNTINLVDALKSLGVQQIFTTRAAFPQLVRGNLVQDRLKVSHVLQKTGIEVNEKGSTAYETKGVSIDHKIGAEIEFKADRPFLFSIIDETIGTLIFSGKVMRPE